MTVSAFGPLVTYDEVIDLLLAVCRHDHTRRQHLAELERRKGLQATSVPDFKAIGRIGDFDDRQPQDAAPALMLFCAGTADPPTIGDPRVLDIVWTIGAEVTYLGINRTDAQRGAAWYATVAAQLMLQRTPRDGLLQRLRLRDMEPQPLAPDQRVATVRLLLEATVPDSLGLHGPGVLSTDDLEPYDPVLLPPTTLANAELDREPLT